MVTGINTNSAPAIAAAAQAAFRKMFPRASTGIIDRLIFDVRRMFTGHYLDYQAADLNYHNFEHTLQAALCFVQLLLGRHGTRLEPRLTPRQAELGLAAVLMHDTGYLKLRSDRAGTGAKYTHVHVLRSCAFAATYLPTVGVTPYELEGVLGAIRCTGPNSRVKQLHFKTQVEELIGCALATADYLAQMAAPDYPDKLEFLFREFHEADAFANVPPGQREFKSTEELVAHTPDFWSKEVFPKLKKEYKGLYRFLAQPYPSGPNAYIIAIEHNIATIKARIA
ncbi:MAG TPA: hypothetical protein VNW30_00960 [Opitutaceae bacterium]|jgi:hypothetical protein|nr:hypothetical protein [Opitutaceae bacterium]